MNNFNFAIDNRQSDEYNVIKIIKKEILISNKNKIRKFNSKINEI